MDDPNMVHVLVVRRDPQKALLWHHYNGSVCLSLISRSEGLGDALGGVHDVNVGEHRGRPFESGLPLLKVRHGVGLFFVQPSVRSWISLAHENVSDVQKGK